MTQNTASTTTGTSAQATGVAASCFATLRVSYGGSLRSYGPYTTTLTDASGGCCCHMSVLKDQQTINEAVRISQKALEDLVALLTSIDFSQWQGSASEQCYARLQRLTSVISETDGELYNTYVMSMNAGGTP
ncbi:MAG: hypothetical protein PUF97_04025 [Bifidobacteriaceae bacterium]|nr:hypothetical protein [Bifidobacteriaceae bacterium]